MTSTATAPTHIAPRMEELQRSDTWGYTGVYTVSTGREMRKPTRAKSTHQNGGLRTGRLSVTPALLLPALERHRGFLLAGLGLRGAGADLVRGADHHQRAGEARNAAA